VGVILLQHRKSGGFSGSFGGAGTQMDNSGSWQRMTSMTKITVVLTAAFMVLSIVLVKL
jgi:preprotein translocase subunit SecG